MMEDVQAKLNARLPGKGSIQQEDYFHHKI
jgi:hypothetical protein